MMKTHILLNSINIAIVILSSCNFSQDGTNNENQLETELYKNDKSHIEKAFISNIEAARRIYFTYLNQSQEVPDSLSGFTADLFGLFACYWDNAEKKYFAVPKPASDYLDVEVGSISYSTDSLKCMALVTVYNNVSLYLKERTNDYFYSGYAIIGIRDSKSEEFKIYPERLDTFALFPNREIVLKLLKKSYYHLIGRTTPQTMAFYRCGINNPKFFDTAHEFSRIDSLDLYWCQTYMISGGHRRPYVFYSNQDSTITKYLCGEPEPEKQAD